MANNLLLIWLAAFPLMGSPGPATLSLAGVGTAFGFRNGLPYLAGIIFGTNVVLVLIATGVTALILAQPDLVSALTIAAVAYILYLAWRIATAPVGVNRISPQSAPSFMPGLVLAIANPKAFAAISAVYTSQTLITDDLRADTILKIISLGFVIFIVNTTWLAFGYAFSRFLTDPTLGRVANAIFAIMLVASVGLALVQS